MPGCVRYFGSTYIRKTFPFSEKKNPHNCLDMQIMYKTEGRRYASLHHKGNLGEGLVSFDKKVVETLRKSL